MQVFRLNPVKGCIATTLVIISDDFVLKNNFSFDLNSCSGVKSLREQGMFSSFVLLALTVFDFKKIRKLQKNCMG